MPKGLKKRKNAKNVQKGSVNKRQIEFKEDGECYGRIVKALGNRRFAVICEDNKEWLGLLPGRFGKRVRFASGDVALIQPRPFGATNVVDILHRYTSEEAHLMVSWKEMPASLVGHAQTDTGEMDNEDVLFVDDDASDFDIDDI